VRIVLAFAVAVGAVWTLAELLEGRFQDVVFGVAVTAVAGALLWRNLKNPELSRKGGEYVKVTFTLDRWPDAPQNGTAAWVETRRTARWHVVLDRVPERIDNDYYGTAQRGWVWLDAAGLPHKVRIDYGTTWKTWPVRAAIPTEQQGNT